MKLLIIDTETCTDSNESSPCEVSATLYQVDENPRKTGAIASVSTILLVTDNQAETVNGITPELTLASEQIAPDCIELLAKMAAAADYPVAFNADFDKVVMSQLMPESFDRTWICAMRDMNWKFHTINAYGGYGLVPLALWLGIGVGTAHRAGDDVRLLVECMNRKKEQLSSMLVDAIALANSPYIELRAMVDYKNRHLASDAKFSWDGERKIWCKKIRQCHYESFVKDLPFAVNILLPAEIAA